jgi:PTH1 family peptidyl-tRNA hydrolase
MAEPTLLKTPRNFLFIASIGNGHPYRSTRHSAGHILLDALTPLLHTRVPLVTSTQPAAGPVFYRTWYSPSYMNTSGPKLVKKLDSWLSATHSDTFPLVQRGDVAVREGEAAKATSGGDDLQTTRTTTNPNTEWQRHGADPRSLKTFHPTLVILHDELEAPLGRVKVKRGGAEQASLRGHRGLISVMESLRGKRLYPPLPGSKGLHGGHLSIMRIGVGIGRPQRRDRDAVADYVLTNMNPTELAAVRAAAGPVANILADELYLEPQEVRMVSKSQ